MNNSTSALAGVAIADAWNVGDGMHADVLIAGAPAGGPGALSLWFNRVPDPASAAAVPASALGTFAAPPDGGAGRVHRIALPFPALWYLWARDAAGTSQEGAVTVHRGGVSAPGAALGALLRDLLWANRAGIAAGMREAGGSGNPLDDYRPQVRRVTYQDMPDEFPAIVIYNPDEQESFVATNRLKQVDHRFTIACLIAHTDPEDQIARALQFGAAVKGILNSKDYDVLRLTDGTEVSFCQAADSRPSVESLGEYGWVSIATLDWTGERHYQQV